MKALKMTSAVVMLTMWVPLRAALADPVGTGFTYQGQLKQSGVPLNATADFRFTLWDAETLGRQVGPTLIFESRRGNGIDVTNGLFTVELDFGSDAFNGDARWLETAVRSPAGFGSLTTLSPRQAITPTPYALQTRGMFVDDAGNVGIGTTRPNSTLDIQGGSTGDALHAASSAGGGYAAVKATATVYGTYGVVGESDSYFGGSFRSSSGTALEASSTSGYAAIFSGGNVGIGTTSPGEKLEVDGNIIADDPTANNHVATKAYVDAQAGGGEPTVISAEFGVYNHATAVNYCRTLTVPCQNMIDGTCDATIYTDWKLPTVEELALFEGMTTDTSPLWTRTVRDAYEHYWIALRLSDGTWTTGAASNYYYFRCVR